MKGRELTLRRTREPQRQRKLEDASKANGDLKYPVGLVEERRELGRWLCV